MKLGDSRLECICRFQLGNNVHDLLVCLCLLGFWIRSCGLTRLIGVNSVENDFDPSMQVLVFNLMIFDHLVRLKDRVLFDLYHFVNKGFHNADTHLVV